MLNILFLDMNAYFASVEQQLRPELRNRPVAVAAVSVDTSCCIAVSYEARRFGIKTGTQVRQARQLCPALKLIESRPEVYVRFHHAIVKAVESCLPVEKICSVDELYCRLRGPEQQVERALSIASTMKQTIKERVGSWLRCSVGVAPNYLLAKTASDMQKPDGVTVIRQHDLPEILYRLRLDDLPGIGTSMLRRLESHGVSTMEQLCSLSERQMVSIWKSVLGRRWWYWLRGHDLPEVPTRRQTVGHSHVLPPELRTDEGCYSVLIRLIHKAAARLRRMDYWAHRMSVHVCYTGQQVDWKVSVALGPCQDTLTMIGALRTAWTSRPRSRYPFHASVTLWKLIATSNMSPPLFAEIQQRTRLAKAMDAINGKFQADTVYIGAMHLARHSAPTRISFTNIPDV